uniref:Uncharacterized protein n=1 Tax=Pseudomonas marincola TaxID=437900 RepID=A0A653E4U8_9PSED
MQQWIYEFCYPLGMPLEFRYRRRILIGPKTVVAGQLYSQTMANVDRADDQACTGLKHQL